MPLRRGNGRTATGSAAAALLAFGTAYLAVGHNGLGQLAAGALALVGVIAVSPAGVAVLALPGVWLAGQRVAGLLSIGDALVAVAALTAVAGGLVGHFPRPLRALTASLGVLLGLDSVSVVAHLSQAGVQEVIHRIIVVLGAAAVGAWLQHTGLWQTAFRALLVVSLVVATVAIFDAVVHGPPAYPLGYQKNFAGAAFTVVIIVLLAAPEACGVRRAVLRYLSLACLIGGLLGTSSRGAILGLALAVLVWALRPDSSRRQVPLVLGIVLVAALGYVALGSIQQQLTDQSINNVPNSLTQRQDVEQATRDLWRTSPLTGVGLRFFTTAEYTGYQAPNNMFDESLAEAGVVGAAGLAFFVGSTLLIAVRLRHPLGQAATMVLVNAFFHGQVDIFWANGQSLNWLVLGAAAAYAASGARAPMTDSTLPHRQSQ